MSSHEKSITMDIRHTRPTCVFMHIPKTGGTSIHKLLVGLYTEQRTSPVRFDELGSSVDHSKQFHLYSGHYNGISALALGCDVRLTCLRNPYERIASLFNFWRSHRWATIEKTGSIGASIAKRSTCFAEFCQSQKASVISNIDNGMVRQVVNCVGYTREIKVSHFRSAIQVLRSHFSVLTTNNIAGSLLPVLRSAGVMESFENPAVPRELVSRELAGFGSFEHVEGLVTAEDVQSILPIEYARWDLELYNEFADGRIKNLPTA